MKSKQLPAATIAAATTWLLAAPAALATINPDDQLAVTNGGGGIVIVTPEQISEEIGFGRTANNDLNGTFTFTFTLDYTQLGGGGTGASAFCGFQLFNNGAEGFAIGDNWPSANYGGFNAPGVGNYDLLDAGNATVPLAPNSPETITYTIDMVAGADDTVTVSFRGKDTVFTGPIDFDEVRVRCGNGDHVANFTNMSVTYSFTDVDGDGLPDDYEQTIIDAAAAEAPPVTLTLADIKGPNDLPATSDYDADGLFDYEEIDFGTDPTLADTDADGLNDGAEVNLENTDPLLADSDGDLLSDGDEVNTHLTDPLEYDSDFDFYSDQIEVGSNSDPNDSGSVPTILRPIDQMGVKGGGNGLSIIDPDSLLEHIYPLDFDEFLVGTFTYTFTIEYVALGNGDGSQGFAGVQLFDLGNERLGIGDNFPSVNWGGFQGPGVGNFELQDSSDTVVPLATGVPKTIMVTIEKIASAPDITTVSFDGKDTVFTGDITFDELRVRAGNAGHEINVSDVSFQFVPSPDQDGDGLPDEWEQDIIDFAAAQDPPVTLALTDIKGPNDAGTSDFDSDGLDDADEFDETTSAVNPDTDGDGLEDGPEVLNHLTDPLDADSDDDRLSDGAEVNVNGTEPLEFDTDGDLINDGLEVASGSNPLVPDAPPVTLTPFGELDLANGPGLEIIDADSLAAFVGQPLDNTFSGTLTYSATLEFTFLRDGTGANSWTGLQLYNGGAENLAIGCYYPSSNWGGFHGPGEFDLLDSSGQTAPLSVGAPETITVSIQYNAGADDVATITFRGRETVSTFDASATRVLLRSGDGNRANFTNMSFAIEASPAGSPVLEFVSFNPQNGEAVVAASGTNGGNFHLRASTDLQNWNPVIGSDFNTDGSITIDTTNLGFTVDGSLFFQIWEGDAPVPF